MLEPTEEELRRLVREGGMDLIHYCLSKASVDSPSPTPVQFRDLAKLPASERDQWLKACLEELDALRKRNVYELVDRPTKGTNVVRNRWVFNTKSDGRRRARLVAKGFSQKEGLDYNELFSPVVRYETSHLLFSIAAVEDWEIESVDVKTAYLYGDLDEEIFMEQPEGFTLGQNKVWRLRKALYGLKQAGLAWWRVMTKSLLDMGFKRSLSDAGVYYHRCPKTGSIIIALVYVDDVVFMGKKCPFYYQMKKNFMERWECRDLGETTEFLGMTISRDRKNKRIYIDQMKYLDKVLAKFGVAARPTQTPLPAGCAFLPYKGTVDPEFRQKFQQLVGSLMYLMIGSRPDIAYAVVKLSQQMASPSEEHYKHGLYLCRYLLSTRRYRLVFNGQSQKSIQGFSDSDFAGCLATHKSTSGNLVLMADGPVSWLSR